MEDDEARLGPAAAVAAIVGMREARPSSLGPHPSSEIIVRIGGGRNDWPSEWPKVKQGVVSETSTGAGRTHVGELPMQAGAVSARSRAAKGERGPWKDPWRWRSVESRLPAAVKELFLPLRFAERRDDALRRSSRSSSSS